MKSRKQRRISGILLLFMGLIFCAGCGGGGNSVSNSGGGSDRDGSSGGNVGNSSGYDSENDQSSKPESDSEYVGEITGVFYTMEEAYEAGYLTREDLTNIAYYHNEWVPYPETLDNSIAEAIKKTQAEDLRKDVPEAKAEDIQIIKYYGEYNGNYAVMVDNPYGEYPAVIVDEWETVGGVKFHYRGFNRIVVWVVDK